MPTIPVLSLFSTAGYFKTLTLLLGVLKAMQAETAGYHMKSDWSCKFDAW